MGKNATTRPGQGRGNGRPTRPPAEVRVFTWVFRGSFFLLAEPLPAKKSRHSPWQLRRLLGVAPSRRSFPPPAWQN